MAIAADRIQHQTDDPAPDPAGESSPPACLSPSPPLIARIAAGDRAALAEFYDAERAPLVSYLRCLVDDPALVEEIVQDTFLGVWTGAAGFAGRASVRSWLFSIARRRAVDALRRRGRHRLRLLPLDDLTLAETPADAPDPADLAVAAAGEAELVAAIARLAPIHREILVLAFGHGLSYPELADILQIPLGTVKSRLNHAKRALRPLLDPDPDSGSIAR
jgi:RNA polymerase sigma factor (sigma-70 family)